MDKAEIIKYIGIGFCQPKFYKPAAWRKAKLIMNKLVSLNVGVIPYDFGRGKGKFITTGDLDKLKLSDAIDQLADVYINSKN